MRTTCSSDCLLSRRFWMFFGLTLGLALPGYGQCVPVGLVPSQDGVTVMGLWSEVGEQIPEQFIGHFLLKSDGDATYRLAATALTDEESSGSIAASGISFSPSVVTLEAGKTTQIRVEFSGVAAAGHYLGLLQISQEVESGDCFREFPLDLDVKVPGQVSIMGEDVSLEIRTVEKSWLVGLLPRYIRQEGIFVRVENAGPTSVSFRDFSLSLKGQKTQHPLSKSDVIWENPDEVIPPGGIATMQFTFTDAARDIIQPDSYSGSLRLHVKNYPQSLQVGISLFSRTGVMGAMIALLLGILVGRMLKSVNNASDQIDLMGRFVPLRAKADNLSDPVSKKALMIELNELERQINEVKDPSQRPMVEAMFPTVETKVAQIVDLDSTYRRLGEQFVEKKVRKEKQQPVLNEMNRVRDAILVGDQVEIKAGWGAILSAAEVALAPERTRSLDGPLEPSAEETANLKAELSAIEQMMQKSEKGGLLNSEEGTAETFWQKLERGFFRFFNLIGGVKINARVKFGVFRPLVAIVTFLVVLLIGFQEIYLSSGDGADTFGAEGVYDHFKLFVWGVVSDIFSRTLTDDRTMTSFSNMVPSAGAGR